MYNDPSTMHLGDVGSLPKIKSEVYSNLGTVSKNQINHNLSKLMPHFPNTSRSDSKFKHGQSTLFSGKQIIENMKNIQGEPEISDLSNIP
jgi:hypothetical protein